MRTIASLFERALASRRGDDFELVLAPELQGLPGMAHGGTVLALFDAAAGRSGPRTMRSHYRKRVPLDVPLRMEMIERSTAADYRLLDEAGALLVDGRVEMPSNVRADAPAGDDRHGQEPVGSPKPVAVAVAFSQSPPVPAHPVPADDDDHEPRVSHELPVSRTCFVCGTANELGLQARFRFDDETVHTVWRAREPQYARNGSLAPVALTALLDEAAFWLGALATGESGMTTELAVTLHREIPVTGSLRVVGDRRRVVAQTGDRRYWDTELSVLDDTGQVVATGRITFVAVRGAARKLASGMLAMNPPEIVNRVFPAYVAV